MPVGGVGPVVTNSSCFFTFAREAVGAARTRYSLRPLLLRVRFCISSGAIVSRGFECVTLLRRHCEERKRRRNPFLPPGGGMDCFAEPVIGAHSRDPLARNDVKTRSSRAIPQRLDPATRRG